MSSIHTNICAQPHILTVPPRGRLCSLRPLSRHVKLQDWAIWPQNFSFLALTFHLNANSHGREYSHFSKLHGRRSRQRFMVEADSLKCAKEKFFSTCYHAPQQRVHPRCGSKKKHRSNKVCVCFERTKLGRKDNPSDIYIYIRATRDDSQRPLMRALSID